MKRTLHVTSPHMKGRDVADARWLLKGHNVFKKQFTHDVRRDGFNPDLAKAAIAAKAFLGYPKRKRKGTFGPILYDLLHGTRKVPLSYRLRRATEVKAAQARAALAKKRAAAAAKKRRGPRALAVARMQIGIKESPSGSNRVKFSSWYGITGPWCAMFVSWCLSQVGSRFHYAYVPAVVDDARRGRNGLSVTRTPQPGDLVCFDWDGGVADHIGFFSHWTSPVHGEFATVEGNTSLGNNSNGGEVMRRTRSTRDVEAFVHVA